MSTVDEPTAVTVPLEVRLDPPEGAPGVALPSDGELLEVEPGEDVPGAGEVVLVVAAPAPLAIEAIPPAAAPTPSRASPLATALGNRRRPTSR